VEASSNCPFSKKEEVFCWEYIILYYWIQRRVNLKQCFPDGVQRIPKVPKRENKGPAGKFHYHHSPKRDDIIIINAAVVNFT
jgi:hypothetical protein